MSDQPVSPDAAPRARLKPNPPRPADRRRQMSNGSLIVVWALSRILTLAVWALFAQHVVGDVNYYWRKINAMAEVGLTNTLIEYPTPVVGLLGLPWLLGGASNYLYVGFFIAAMIALDGWLFGSLLRRAERHHRAVWTWILAVPALGPLSYLRFDMIPAVLAGMALLGFRRHPKASGALVALGAAIKLWPALLLPALLADRSRRVAALIGFAVTGVGLALYSWIVGGWDRLISPLTWQSDRGLQVESVWVVPAMIGRLVDPGAYRVEMSKYQAFEIFGPLTDPMLLAATVSTVLGGLFIIALAVRCWRSGTFNLHAAAWVMLAVTAVMITTNKTFSPQYMLWLAGPAAVLALGRPRRLGTGVPVDQPGPSTRSRLIASFGVVALSALTQVIYPFFYDDLISNGVPGAGTYFATIMLALRNVVIAIGTVWVCVMAWQSVRPANTTTRPPEQVG